MENLTFTDGLLGGQPWLEEQENGPTFFPKPPLAPDEPEVIKNFDPERRPQLNFVLPSISQTDASTKPTPPPENPRPRFHDPELVDERWDATDDGFEYDAEMRAEVSNRIGIAHWAGESLDEIAPLYPILRAQYGHEVLGNYDISEVELDRHFRDDAKFKKELETAVADIPGRLVEGYISDIIWNKTTPAEENYQKWKADHPEYQGAFPDTRMLEAVRQYHAATTAKLAPLAPQIRLLSDYFAEATGQTAHGLEFSGPDAEAKRDKLFDFMTTLPPDLRKLILIGIADSAKRTGSLDYKGTGVQTYEALGRNWNIIRNAKLNAEEFAAEAHLNRLLSGKPLYRSPDGRLFDSPRYLRAGPEAKLLSEDERNRLAAEAEHRLARLGFEREVHYFADNRYDPITVHHTGVAGFLETGLYGTASSAGFTGLAMLPGGAFLAMAASASEEYTKLRAEHSEIAPSDARLIAAVSGVIQGGMERVQGRWFLGTLPTVEKAMNELANPVVTSGLKRTFIRGGITAVGENVVEGAQDLTTPILMNFANALQMDVPGVSAMDILMPWAGERADVAAGLSLMLIGSLFGIHSRERRMLNSPEQRRQLLELTGFSPEQISRIEQGGTVEEKLAKAREELANRNQADISRGAKLYQAELDTAQKLTSQSTVNAGRTTAVGSAKSHDGDLDSTDSDFTENPPIDSSPLSSELQELIERINPLKGSLNCVACAIATDAGLAGRPASARLQSEQPIIELIAHYESDFNQVDGQNQIADLLLKAGNGSRGIVLGISRDERTMHVFNAVNLNGRIRFLDGQSASDGLFNFSRFHSFEFMITSSATE